MPLVTCPDCGNEVSGAAPSCPHCGRPMQQAPPKRTHLYQQGCNAGCVVLVILMGVMALVIALGVGA